MEDGNNKIKFGVILSVAFFVAGVGYFIWHQKGFRIPHNKKWAKDQDTIEELKKLHPKIRVNVIHFFNEIEKKTALIPFITNGLRGGVTQMELHESNAQNAAPGLSDHEYGFAVDINLKGADNKIKLRKSTPKTEWLSSGVPQIAKRYKFKWGGDFNNYYDPIHFYNDFDIPAEEMKNYKRRKDGYLKV